MEEVGVDEHRTLTRRLFVLSVKQRVNSDLF